MLATGKAACLLLAGALGVMGYAAAQTGGAAPQPADATLPVCTLAADGASLAVQPCRPAPPPLRRRRAAGPYIGGLTPSAPAMPTVPGGHAPTPAAVPGSPRPVLGCDSSGCRDGAGTRYGVGVGNAAIDPNGRPCNRHGVWLQCF